MQKHGHAYNDSSSELVSRTLVAQFLMTICQSANRLFPSTTFSLLCHNPNECLTGRFSGICFTGNLDVFWWIFSNVFLFGPWWYSLSATPSCFSVVWEEFIRKYTTPTSFLLKVSVRFPWIKEKPSSCIAMPGAVRWKPRFYEKESTVIPYIGQCCPAITHGLGKYLMCHKISTSLGMLVTSPHSALHVLAPFYRHPERTWLPVRLNLAGYQMTSHIGQLYVNAQRYLVIFTCVDRQPLYQDCSYGEIKSARNMSSTFPNGSEDHYISTWLVTSMRFANYFLNALKLCRRIQWPNDQHTWSFVPQSKNVYDFKPSQKKNRFSVSNPWGWTLPTLSSFMINLNECNKRAENSEVSAWLIPILNEPCL